MLTRRRQAAASTSSSMRTTQLAFGLGILLLTLFLCRASSLIKPQRIASQVHASPATLTTVRNSVEKKALEVTRVSADDGHGDRWGFQNLQHRFASSFGERGWELSPIIPPFSKTNEAKDEARRWSWRYELTSIARGDNAERVGSPIVSAGGTTITLDHSGGVKEWYKNAHSGIEQGFEIKERPIKEHAGELALRGAVETDLALLSEDSRSLTFGHSGQALLRYAELVVFDSTGKSLPSRLSFAKNTSGGELALYIDDSQATYPLTVDPVTSSPLWTKNGSDISGQFGFSVASAGDVNGDGFADVVVGDPKYSSGQTDEGAVYLFLGAAAGPSTVPNLVLQSNSTSALFGYSVSSAGDVNNDGFSDVIVGAPGSTVCAYPNGGKVFAFYGSADGLSTTADWSLVECIGTFFGESVSTAGDVNNDGFSDVIIGCPGCLASSTFDGEAFVVAGSAGGLQPTALWSYNTDDGVLNSALIGTSVASAGDVNNDGFSDILVGAENWGGVAAAFLFRGSAAGPSTTVDWSVMEPVTSDVRVSSAGDTNGDGFDDVLVGYPLSSQIGEGGVVSLFFGSAAGLSNGPDWRKIGSDYSTTQLGSAVSSAGDINNDGFADILISSSVFEVGGVAYGRAFLFLGSASGPEATEAWIATGEVANADFGWSAAYAGDVNNDGLPDTIVGSLGYPDNVGSALIWSDFNLGPAQPTPTPTPTPTSTPITVSPGGGGLPPPLVTTSNTNATITAPQVAPQLTTRARNAAIKKLMQRGLTKAQATKALSKLTVTYIFTISQGGSAAAASGNDITVQRSSITRRSKRNTITYNNLAPGGKSATYRIEISTRKPPVVLGVTKPSGKTPFTITRSFTTTRD